MSLSSLTKVISEIDATNSVKPLKSVNRIVAFLCLLGIVLPVSFRSFWIKKASFIILAFIAAVFGKWHLRNRLFKCNKLDGTGH